jgi:hypothetical protein
VEGMHKNTYRRDAPGTEALYCKLHKQSSSVAQLVVDAVVQYNENEPQLGYFRRKDINERLIQEAEEEAAKVFLDGIFDTVQNMK